MTINTPENWTHHSGFRLNADGKAIAYHHTDKPLEAIIESTINEHTEGVGYYTVIFDTSTDSLEPVERQRLFRTKEEAIEDLEKLMKKHN